MPYQAFTQDIRQHRAIWFALLAGPIVWSIHFIIVYGVDEIACKSGLLQFQLLGLNGIVFVVIGATIAAVAVTLYASYLAYRHFRSRTDTRQWEWHAEERLSFMALAALLFNGLFTLTMLITAIPALYVPTCSWI